MSNSNIELSKDLKSLIRSRFEPRTGRLSKPGFDKVIAEEYELFDSGNNTILIAKNQPDMIASCSGITMAFIVGQFTTGPFKLDLCPKPGCKSTRLSKPYAGGKLW